MTKVGSKFLNQSSILAGVSQSAILSPILYNIFATDRPTSSYTSVAEFTDEKII